MEGCTSRIFSFFYSRRKTKDMKGKVSSKKKITAGAIVLEKFIWESR